MEPLSALSLAGTIVQFVDFGTRIFSDTAELYASASGAIDINVQLELVVGDLRGVIEKVRRRIITHSQDGSTTQGQSCTRGFDDICDQADDLAGELISRLERLKVKDAQHRRWQSFKAAVRSAWNQDQIDVLKNRLLSFRDIMNTRTILLILSNVDQQGLFTSAHFDSLGKHNQLVISSMLRFEQKVSDISCDLSQYKSQHLALTQLLSRLESLNQDEHHRTRTMVANRKLGLGYTIGEIVADIDMLSVKDAKEQEVKIEVNHRICTSLSFPYMNTRYEEVVDAFPTTFDWAFQDSKPGQSPWCNLSYWLQKDNGIYWINGKAGSGKTTLMKHIVDDGKTQEYLKIWADKEPLCIATFFFWLSGDQAQRSQIGLFRSLLYQILSACPDLGPIILPDKWAATYSSIINSNSGVYVPLNWTLKELMRAFKLFIQQKEHPLKTCLLVDGLDEFGGEHDVLAALFKTIGQSANVKVCVSSRPLVIFQDTFGTQPSLRLQDLTFFDIQYCLTKKFHDNDHFHRFANSNSEAAQNLITQTTMRADGVFLWVRMAVRSLLNGLINRDSVGELHARLCELPREIEPLYQHFLSRIDSRYLVWASRVFRLLETVNGFQSANRDLTVRQLDFALSDDLQWGQIDSLTPEASDLRFQNTAVHVIARCAGLLEVGQHQRQQHARIKWFHPTARDFIIESPYGREIMQRSLDLKYDPHLAMARSTIFELMYLSQIQEGKFGPTVHLFNRVDIAMRFIAAARQSHGTLQPLENMLLDQLQSFMVDWSRTKRISIKNWEHEFIRRRRIHLRFSVQPSDVNFLKLAVYYDLANYIRKSIMERHTKERKKILRSLENFRLNLLTEENKYYEGSPRVKAALKEMQSKINGTRIKRKKKSRYKQLQALLRRYERNRGSGSSIPRKL